MKSRSLKWTLAIGCLAVGSIVAFSGCQQKEKIVDIKTPAGSVEVTRDKATGDTSVDVKREKDKDNRSP